MKRIKNIVAIVGDYYHQANWAEEALSLSRQHVSGHEDIRLEYVSVDNITEALAQKPDLVILFKEDRLNPTDEQINLWMTPEVEQAITQYVYDGGSWLAWHSGLASYNEEGAYTKMLRGYFIHHPQEHQQVKYTSIQVDSSVEAVQPFEILDEHYFVHCEEENTNVFLRSESVDGSSIAGWSHSFGQGKVCCLTPAHNYEGLTHPIFIKLLAHSIEWSLEK